jgi:hypothetical protein
MKWSQIIVATGRAQKLINIKVSTISPDVNNWESFIIQASAHLSGGPGKAIHLAFLQVMVNAGISICTGLFGAFLPASQGPETEVPPP